MEPQVFFFSQNACQKHQYQFPDRAGSWFLVLHGIHTCTNYDQLSEILYQRLSASTLSGPARMECPWTRLDDTTAPVLGSIRSMAYFAIWLSDSRHVFYGIDDVTLDTRSTTCLLLVRWWMVRGTANCFGGMCLPLVIQWLEETHTSYTVTSGNS